MAGLDGLEKMLWLVTMACFYTCRSSLKLMSIIQGDIISFSFFGRHIIVLNSAKVAVELLEKRSSIYSDRPYLAMGGDL